MEMSTNTLKIIRFIIAVIGIASFVQFYNEKSIVYLIVGIIAVVVAIFLKNILNQKRTKQNRQIIFEPRCSR